MLSVKNLKQQIGEMTLSVPDLHLQAGVTLLVGENGAGKTTFLRLLATVDSLQLGEISYHGRPLQADLPLIRSQIGYVPSEIQMYEEMTALRWLMYFAELKGITDKKWIKTLLTKFHLLEYENVKIRHMSEGVKRRLVIAQAFLASPAFLFLDEPLNGMDLNERKWVISLLSQLNPNVIILVAVHELNEWEGVANHIVWLENGRIGFKGTASRWLNEAPMKVFEGILTMEDWEKLAPSELIFFRQEEGGMFVRVVAYNKPFASLVEVPPMIEDIFFMKKDRSRQEHASKHES